MCNVSLTWTWVRSSLKGVSSDGWEGGVKEELVILGEEVYENNIAVKALEEDKEEEMLMDWGLMKFEFDMQGVP